MKSETAKPRRVSGLYKYIGLQLCKIEIHFRCGAVQAIKLAAKVNDKQAARLWLGCEFGDARQRTLLTGRRYLRYNFYYNNEFRHGNGFGDRILKCGGIYPLLAGVWCLSGCQERNDASNFFVGKGCKRRHGGMIIPGQALRS